MDDDRAYAELEAQIGRGAGNIAATHFRHHTWLTEIVTDAARAVHLSLCSGWFLAEIWNNGTTRWESPADDQTTTVTPDGEIHLS
jgi:hypothetical protein